MDKLLFSILVLTIVNFSGIAALDVRALDGRLLIASDQVLRSYDTNGKPLEVISRLGAQSIDYDCSANEIVWSDLGNRDINEVYIQGDKLTTLPKPQGKWVPKSVAVDSINHKIYVSENYNNSVYLFDRKTGGRTVIRKVNRPTRYFNWQLALDAKEGHLFIQSDFEVIRTDLNGDNAQVIYLEIAEGPDHESLPMNMTRFTIDTQSKRLFWIDSETYKVWSMNYNGQDRKVHFEKVTPMEAHVFDSLTVLKGFLYWADFQNNRLIKVNLSRNGSEEIFELDTMDPESIKGINCSS